jgi:hypothetical protein
VPYELQVDELEDVLGDDFLQSCAAYEEDLVMDEDESEIVVELGLVVVLIVEIDCIVVDACQVEAFLLTVLVRARWITGKSSKTQFSQEKKKRSKRRGSHSTNCHDPGEDELGQPKKPSSD